MAWWSRPRALAASAALCSALAASGLSAQESGQPVLDRPGLDRLQIVSLGASLGRVQPSQVVPTQVYAIGADYGEISRNWRVVFDVSYWESRYSDRVVQTFLDSLRSRVTDPTNDFTIAGTRVTLYDVTFGSSLRWQSASRVAVRPYGSAGLALHVINAEGPLIRGTFVERSLDNIGAGFYANGGVLFRPYGRVIFDAQARVDLVSSFRSVQLRAGALYFFGAPHGEKP